jgi:hypothetical protein
MAKYHTRYVKEHYIKRDIKRELYEAFIEWCGERSINICLEKALRVLRGNIPLNTGVNVRGNIASNTGASKSKPSPSGGYEWCYSKSKVRNLQNLLDWVDRRFGLIDWWEEGDKLCFETREKPAKANSGAP